MPDTSQVTDIGKEKADLDGKESQKRKKEAAWHKFINITSPKCVPILLTGAQT